ncbi:polysaccharide deacetylase family protein [Sporosarcina sp. Te-1]|uniref:polysaccharide deacetylase family protein n=1 Tax=Sporosarcina sp. Te-1 TaxID=2818390 RepID=UPI001A9EFFD7|nr:polysaccharide deacetylase family protein [Sporosarcina sp. Te-1]QTD41928.1 polysaccharide deacetylase family protein [Sporosarcina sp. Te-1]
MKQILFVLTLCILVAVVPIMKPKTTTNSGTIPTAFVSEKDLKLIIDSYAKTMRIKPVNAVVDPIWKAIPGYNGLVVDVEASFDRMAPNGKFDESLVVYKELAPAVRLADLPPSAIYKGNPEKPMVTFLINVAWGDEFIRPMLDVLAIHNVKVTFFLDGSWTAKTPDLAKEIQRQGHEIGNHAYSHPDLAKSSLSKTRDELQKTSDIIQQTVGVKPTWFGPPSGSFTDETVTIAREQGMLTVLWTLDTVDWKHPDTDEMVNRILSNVDNGSMILMHPTKPTAEGLDKMIRGIQEKGLAIGTVSGLLSEKRIDSVKHEEYYMP